MIQADPSFVFASTTHPLTTASDTGRWDEAAVRARDRFRAAGVVEAE